MLKEMLPMKLSILIPSKNCSYSMKTVQDVLDKAVGDIEVIVNVDDEWPDEIIKDERVKYLHPEKPIGMRGGINAGLRIAKGDYIMKTDDHCLFAKGFDKTLAEDMQKNWLVIPRRYPLHADEWRRDERMPIKDYHYLAFPRIGSKYGLGLFPQEWKQRTYERMNDPKYEIDDTMTFQGSCWFANRKYFMERVGLLDDSADAYSTFSGEPLEIGLKYWLGGGEIKVNKKTWYAHLFKNRGYYAGRQKDKDYKLELKNIAGHTWACRHWMNDEEPKMIHKFEWLVEKFWPIPTWEPDWREKWKKLNSAN